MSSEGGRPISEGLWKLASDASNLGIRTKWLLDGLPQGYTRSMLAHWHVQFLIAAAALEREAQTLEKVGE